MLIWKVKTDIKPATLILSVTINLAFNIACNKLLKIHHVELHFWDQEHLIISSKPKQYLHVHHVLSSCHWWATSCKQQEDCFPSLTTILKSTATTSLSTSVHPTSTQLPTAVTTSSTTLDSTSETTGIYNAAQLSILNLQPDTSYFKQIEDMPCPVSVFTITCLWISL